MSEALPHSRRCKECREIKPAAEFQRHSGKYLRSRCKACMKKTVPTESPPDPKRCSKCEEEKPLGEFSRDRTKKDGYDGLCKDCRKPEHLRSRAETREREALLVQKLKRCSTCKEVKETSAFTPRKGRKSGLSSKCKVCIDAVLKEYRQRNSDRVRVWTGNRRARELGASGSHSPEQFRALCEFYNHACLCCGWKGKMTFDHVVPLSKGGGNTILNAQPLCLSCNCRKNNKSTDYRNLAEFMTFIDQLKATGLLREL